MRSRRQKVAILVYDLFEQAEFEEPLQALEKAEFQVDVVSANRKKLQAMHHNVPGDNFRANFLLDKVHPEKYAALVLPGGALNADQLRMVQKARDWVHFCLDNNRLIAAICHAPWLLVSADAIEERRLTSYFTLQDDIRNVGGEWVDLPVVIDGNLITSRKPSDLRQFNSAIIKWLRQNSNVTTSKELN